MPPEVSNSAWMGKEGILWETGQRNYDLKDEKDVLGNDMLCCA